MNDQSYYWTPEWQADEAESRREIEAGLGRTFATAEDTLAWLSAEDD